MISAKKMEKKIHDQLEESNANKQLRVAAFECALFGTGVMKGPFAVDKEYPKYEEGEYTPLFKTVPQTHLYLYGTSIQIQMQLIWMKQST